jgi:hypothetical protein
MSDYWDGFGRGAKLNAGQCHVRRVSKYLPSDWLPPSASFFKVYAWRFADHIKARRSRLL